MTPGLFVADALKGLLVAAVLGLPLAAAVLWLMGSAGAYWWAWAWGLWMVFNLALLIIYPMFIAPLFNKFTPLTDPDLAGRIQRLAQRCGFALNGLFVMDGSRRSAHGNAYFTGFGRSRRIVFFDTLLARLNGDEIEAVLAHELGHFAKRHIIKRICFSFGAALVFFALLGWISQQPWFYVGLGVLPQLGGRNDAMALLLFFLVIPVFTFVFTPLASWYSRRDEFEADRYAAEQSSPDRLVSALVKLYDDNAATLTPDPVHSAFYDSHPPAAVRHPSPDGAGRMSARDRSPQRPQQGAAAAVTGAPNEAASSRPMAATTPWSWTMARCASASRAARRPARRSATGSASRRRAATKARSMRSCRAATCFTARTRCAPSNSRPTSISC